MLNDEIEKNINLKYFPKKKIAIKRIVIKSDKKKLTGDGI
jgi:ribonuclease PH